MYEIFVSPHIASASTYSFNFFSHECERFLDFLWFTVANRLTHLNKYKNLFHDTIIKEPLLSMRSGQLSSISRLWRDVTKQRTS